MASKVVSYLLSYNMNRIMGSAKGLAAGGIPLGRVGFSWPAFAMQTGLKTVH